MAVDVQLPVGRGRPREMRYWVLRPLAGKWGSHRDPGGLGDNPEDGPSAVGAALALPPQPYFATSLRGTSLSNKITPLIWTAV